MLAPHTLALYPGKISSPRILPGQLGSGARSRPDTDYYDGLVLRELKSSAAKRGHLDAARVKLSQSLKDYDYDDDNFNTKIGKREIDKVSKLLGYDKPLGTPENKLSQEQYENIITKINPIEAYGDICFRNFSGVYFVDGIKFKNINNEDYSNFILEGASLPSADFSEFQQLSIIGEKADMRNVNLEGKYTENYDLANANLQGADLSISDFYDGTLEGANLEGADLSGMLSDGGFNFRNANMRNTNLSNTIVSNWDCTGANMEAANFSHASIENFENNPQSLKNANFQEAKMAIYTFDIPESEGINFTGIKELENYSAVTRFTEINLKGACFNRCSYDTIYFEGTDIKESLFNDFRLSDVYIELDEFDCESFETKRTFDENSKLNGSFFLDMDLSQCLSLNRVPEENLKGTYYYKTKFSKKFDPKKKGMVPLDEAPDHSVSFRLSVLPGIIDFLAKHPKLVSKFDFSSLEKENDDSIKFSNLRGVLEIIRTNPKLISKFSVNSFNSEKPNLVNQALIIYSRTNLDEIKEIDRKLQSEGLI